MTDRELLEAAASAAGYTGFRDSKETWAYLCDGHGGPTAFWNPMTDDGDALRLAVTLAFINPGCFPSPAIELEKMLRNGMTPDWYAATRRAIVKAAASLAKAPA